VKISIELFNEKKESRIQKGLVVRGSATLGASDTRYAVQPKGLITKGSMNLGNTKNRYTASKKLAEEAKEATQRVVQKVKAKKQGDVVEINPEKDILGSGVQQSTY